MRGIGISRRALRLCFAAPVVCLSVGTAALGGTITGPTVIGTDADTGIGTGTTYTHLLDFIADSSAAKINGVQFLAAGRSGTGFTTGNIPGQILESQYNLGGSETGAETGSGLEKLLKDFYYNSTNNGLGQSETVTLTGLTAGRSYRLKLFYRQWDANLANTRFTDLTFNNGSGTNDTLRVNEDESDAARMIVYDYTAGPTGRLVVSFAEGGNASPASWHQYGLSNEVVPEPGALALGCLCAVGFLARRRSRLAAQA